MNASVLRVLCLWLCVCCMLPRQGWGCAYDDSIDYNSRSLFRQDLVHLPQRAFFTMTFEKQPWPKRTEASNYAAWKALAPKSTDDDVHALVYMASQDDLQRLLAHITSTAQHTMQANAHNATAPKKQPFVMPLPGQFKNNRLVQALVQNNRADVVEYLSFIRSVAPITNVKEDDWEYRVPDPDAAYAFAKQAEDRFLTTQDTFLRLRYGFQALRLYYLLQDYNRAINLFEANTTSLPPEMEETYWMRSYYGGALFRTLRKPEALLQFAQVFMHSPRYMERGYTGAKWSIDQTDNFQKDTLPTFTEAMQRAATPAERQALLILGAYFETHDYADLPKRGGPLFTLMEEAASTGNIPPDLPLLISRFILKADKIVFDDLFVQSFLHTPEPDPTPVTKEQEEAQRLAKDIQEHQQATAQARAALGAMNPLVERVWAQAGAPHFWGAAAAHVSLMLGNVEETQQRLAKTHAQQPPQPIADQLHLTGTVLSAMYAPFTPEMENTLVADLNWLTQLSPKQATAKEQDKIAEDMIWRLGAARTILCSIASPRYANLHKPGSQFYALMAWQGIKKPANFPYWEKSSYNRYTQNWPVLDTGNGEATNYPPFSPKDYPALEAFTTASKTQLEAYLVEKSPITYSILHRNTKEGLRTSYMALSSENDADDNSQMLREPLRAFGWYKLPEQMPAPLNETFMIAEKNLPESVQALMQETPLGTLPAPLLQQFFTTLIQQVNHGAPYRAGKQNTEYALGLLMALPGEAGASALYTYGKFQYNQGYIEPTYRFPYEMTKETLPGYALLRAAKEWNDNVPIYRLMTAAEAFTNAAQKTANKEFGARALFMAHLATQLNKDVLYYSDRPAMALRKHASESPYFARLVQDYADTRFYQEARRQCSLLRDFSPTPPVKNAAAAQQ